MRRSKRKNPTAVAESAAAARKKIKAPIIIGASTSTTEPVNTDALQNVVITPSSNSQFWLPQVTSIPNVPDCSTGPILDFAGSSMKGNSICTTTQSMILPINSVITNTINQPNYVHADLAFDVSQSTRENIQKSEYIDLALLLSNDNSMLQDTQRLVLNEGALRVQAGNKLLICMQ